MDARADVVIVGGGFAGMATAWALGRRGIRDVVVLERESELGRYASGRSAGLGRQLAEDDELTSLTVRGAALLRTSFSHVWTPTGGVLSFDDLAHAQAYSERAARFGVATMRLTRDELLRHWPELAALDITAAVHIPSDGVIAVGPLLEAFAQGVRVELGTGVETIVPVEGGPREGGARARLLTSRGELQARVVVDACGAWAGRALGDPQLASFKRHVYVLDAPASASTPFVWHLGACEVYVRDAGGSVMCSPCDAAPVQPGDQQPDDDGEARLRRALAGSPLATVAIARSWACQRTFPRAEAGVGRGMQLGRDPHRPWLVWAAGLGGHGATASAAVGEAAAAAVIDALG